MTVSWLALALVWPNTARAQVGYLWSPGELVAQSDLVVICEHAGTAPTGVKTVHPGLQPDMPVVEVISTLKVLAFLKGFGGTEVAVRHYWIDRERYSGALANAGSELRFAEKAGPYLVFLRRMPDGQYAPTSGYTFPTTSVQRLVENGRDR